MHDTGMDTADINRRIENLLRLGKIIKVDHDARKVQVQTGELTPWLNWPTEMGRNFKRWRPLRVGTQVLIGCLSGDPAQANILGMLYTEDLQSPSVDPDIDLIEFNDGTKLQYNSSNSTLLIDCTGPVTVKSPDKITLDTPQTDVKGKLDVDGLLTYKGGMSGSGGTGAAAQIQGDIQVTSGDVTADAIALKGHTHTGDSGGNTGTAQ